MKLFIDRCNCFRPPKFEKGRAVFDNKGILNSKGAYILVGSAREKFDAAERTIGGFFIWCGIAKIGKLTHAHDEQPLGAVRRDKERIEESRNFGITCANAIE